MVNDPAADGSNQAASGTYSGVRPVPADLAFFETPAGGALFSTGSIAWCGSLSHNGYDNNVARITGNVLRRFLREEPFKG